MTRQHALGRHVNHDPRSKQYRVARHLAPVSVQWARRSPILDQGQVGSCTGNSAESWKATDNKWRGGSTTATEADALNLYHLATVLDPYPGTYPPDDTGSDGLSVAKVLQQTGACTSYIHGFSLADLLDMLQDGGVMVGMNWYSRMDDPDPDGLCHVGGTIEGGHEPFIYGVDMEAQQFLLANSWGTSWGKGGYFKLSFADMTRLLSEDGDVTQPVLDVVTPTPIPPEPTPTPDKPGWLQRLWNWIKSFLFGI